LSVKSSLEVKVEETPEFKEALNKAADDAVKEFLYGKPKKKSKRKAVSRGGLSPRGVPLPPENMETPEAIEQYRADLKRYTDRVRFEAEMRSNEHYRQIMEDLSNKYSPKSGNANLICPKCKGKDMGNRMNGKPWCMICNIALMTTEEAEKGTPPKKPNVTGPTFEPIEICTVNKR